MKLNTFGKGGLLVVCFGVGVDNIDLEKAKEYGIKVTNVPVHGDEPARGGAAAPLVEKHV